MATTSTDCNTAIAAALSPLPAAVVAALPAAPGYAYQAFVLTRLGETLRAIRHWDWTHPANTPTFAETAGATWAGSLGALSYCHNRANDRGVCQELTVSGASGATHQLDLALIRLQALPNSWVDAVPSHIIGTVVECKNWSRSVTVATARELVGLAADLHGLYRVPRRRKTVLMTAHGVTPNAIELLEAFDQVVLENARPGPTAAWAAWLGNRLRFA